MTDPHWEIVPREPFVNISRTPGVEVLPMRGSSTNWELVSRLTGVDEDTLIDMAVDDQLEARNNSIVRRVS